MRVDTAIRFQPLIVTFAIVSGVLRSEPLAVALDPGDDRYSPEEASA